MVSELDSTGAVDSELAGASPHIVDYWQVITRRLWLVVLIFGVTTASAIWAVSHTPAVYETSSSIQINEKFQAGRPLTLQAAQGLGGVNLFVDPIESEIQVLASGQVALRVVDALGLRVLPENPNLVRSDLFLNAWIDPAMEDGSFQLAYDDEGAQVRILNPAGVELASGPVGSELDLGLVRPTPQPPPWRGTRLRTRDFSGRQRAR